MNKLFCKLKKRKGATLIIALVFFLICIVTASIVLTVALSNAKLLSNLRTTEQAYQTVSSAALLLRDSLQGYSYHESTTSLSHDKHCGKENIINAPYIVFEKQILKAANLLYDLQEDYAGGSSQRGTLKGFTKLIDQLVTQRTISGIPTALSATLSVDTGEFEELAITITCGINYDLDAVIKNNSSSFTMTLHFPATQNNTQALDSSQSHSYGVKDGEICVLTQNTAITTFSWNSCQILKGEIL